MSEFNLALAIAGVTVLGLGLYSRPLNRSIFSLPLLAFLIGLVVGPSMVGLLHPGQWGDEMKILEEATRLTLGVSLMGIALRIPADFVFRHWRSLAVLLGLGMPLMCMASSVLAWGFLEVGMLAALLVGAAVCATDPVVASSIVTGGVAKENLPGRFRHTLSAESALNDGLALPLVMIPVLLLTKSTSSAWSEWVLHVMVWQVGGSILFGALLGYAAGWALRIAEDRGLIDQPSFLVTTLALTLVALGLGKVLGTDSILAVFATGVAFDQQVEGQDRAEEANIQEAVNLFFTLPVFILFGLMAPVEKWQALGWSGIGLVIAVLALRRLPIILLLRPWIERWRDMKVALLAGWFGPIGVSALFYALLIHHKTGDEKAWVAGSLLVAASLFAHGMTAAPVGKAYGRRYERARRQND